MQMDPVLLGNVVYLVLFALPFLFAYIVILELWNYIHEYLWYKWYLGNEYITLEIRLPKEQKKTPVAMEYLFNGLYEPGDSSGWKESWFGVNTLPILSFEVASIGGSIHFFFWVPKKFKARVEAHTYAQFPQAEVIEVPDYTRLVDFDFDTHRIMGFDYRLERADPIPIKTYKMLKLDMPGTKEEEKIDPITQTLEVMASIGPHEQMWWQIVTRANKSKYTKTLSFRERLAKAFADKNPLQLFYNEKTNWQAQAKEVIDKIREQYKPASKDELLPMGGMATPQDNEFLKLVSENASKVNFECGMRTIYFAPKEHFDSAQPSNMGSMFKAYGAGEPYNNFKPAFVAATNDKWWEPGQGEAITELKKLMHPDYAGRRFFNMHGTVGYGYYKNQYTTFALSTEELATLYHFPGSVSQTPTFERIPSATSQAPANLPIGGSTFAHLPRT
ncbi:MAG: hypothetical protein ACKKL4_00645 [Patescibacteria group bacterium]